MMKRVNILFVLAAFLLTIASCKKETEDPVIPNEEEVITTLIYTLTPSAGGADVVMSFQDLDGDGGNDPVMMHGTLQANSVYTGTIQLLNELESPAENITEEVEEEAEEHQFFYTTSVDSLNIAYADMDADGNPIGISTAVITSSAGSGLLTIVLRHEPAKDASGVSSGDITNAGGETDIEVTFNVDVL